MCGAELSGEHNLLYPCVVVSHLHIHPGHISLATPNTPAHDTRQLPESSNLTDQRSPTISLAGILTLLTTCTEEPGVEDKVRAQPGLLQLPLTVEI